MRPRQKLLGADLIAFSERLRTGTPAEAIATDSTALIREDRDAR